LSLLAELHNCMEPIGLNCAIYCAGPLRVIGGALRGWLAWPAS